MKKLYWRPQKISRMVLVLLAAVSVVGLLVVENFQTKVNQKYYDEKIAASHLALTAFTHLKKEILNRELPINAETDPIQSGLIGELTTVITSNTGYLEAKQTSLNPNFAAVVVDLLKKSGAREGDIIAIGQSGSFPAFNVCVYAALATLKLKAIIITSASASQWGANRPEFSWLDMERSLLDAGIFPYHSGAASIGGIDDNGLGMRKKAKRLLQDTIEKNGILFLEPANFDESLALRYNFFREQAGNDPIRAYINIGGGTTSVGHKTGKLLFKPGLNKKLPAGAEEIDSVMTRFVKNGTPVIHLVEIAKLAKKYGFPISPRNWPPVGEGLVFKRSEYNNWLVVLVLAFLGASLVVFIRSDLGLRISELFKKK